MLVALLRGPLESEWWWKGQKTPWEDPPLWSRRSPRSLGLSYVSGNWTAMEARKGVRVWWSVEVPLETKPV
ncbi:hypothetical protein E2C01_089677 [Portunus trituberculatus]|uniref:Uncharacterized protein n=1 Tax=Portunus trituberculatus TaxID=210409 RepID=A0A5B7JJQ5_PORTR|nr:hypothetical protein [Portunus trituberculatus]